MSNNSIKVAGGLERYMSFICPECGDDFHAQLDWREHLNHIHNYIYKTEKDLSFRQLNPLFHECIVCKKLVENGRNQIALLQYHHFQHLPYNNMYLCRLCANAKFTRKRALCAHLVQQHSSLINKIEQARQAIKPKSNKRSSDTLLPNSFKNHEFYLNFVCPQCGQTIEHFQKWLHHLKEHPSTSTKLQLYRLPGTKNHYCQVCKKMIWSDDRIKLLRHRFTHLSFKMYFQCAFCIVKKTYKMEVLKHFITAHPEEFAAVKAFIRKPIEWGEPFDDKLNNEVEEALGISTSGAHKMSSTIKSVKIESQGNKKTDLIQEAWLNSSIDLEKETSIDESDWSLSQSSIGLQQLFTTETDELNPLEFDELCNEMFDEIIEPAKLITNKGSFKNNIVKTKKGETFNTEVNSVAKGIDDEASAIFQRPPHKRIKLNDRAADATSISSERGCKRKVVLKELLESHIIFICPECGREFNCQVDWRNHVFKEHELAKTVASSFKRHSDGKSSYCLVCNRLQITTNQSELQRHYFLHMPYQSYLKCTICGKTKSSKPKMLHHLQENHAGVLESSSAERGDENESESNFQCHNCGERLDTQLNLLQHWIQCAPPPLTTRNFNIAENLKLIKHLKNARHRISLMA